MSGHSKWATTKRQKEVTDSKRSGLFTKLAKVITIAARDGGDPETNFKLRMAIDRAKKFSLPKENIDRAIKSGTGELKGEIIEEITYEAYGPEGIALIIETITDNKNRTVGEIKHALSKSDGNLGSSGSVLWLFERRGVIYPAEKLNNEQELVAIDAGAQDIINADEESIIYTKDSELNEIKQKLEAAGLLIDDAKIEFVAKNKIAPTNEEKIIKLLEALDELDDIQNVYTNADI
jgi:YebC/PmpR family DNA-binding regulatory protein